eukprot:13693262-Alexandrium_andersonii.AAC.1
MASDLHGAAPSTGSLLAPSASTATCSSASLLPGQRLALRAPWPHHPAPVVVRWAPALGPAPCLARCGNGLSPAARP